MFDIFTVIQNNYTCVIISVIFFVFVRFDKSFARKTERKFLYAISLVMVLTIVDIVEAYFASLDYPTVWRYVLSMIGYSLRPAIILFIISIMLRHDKLRKKKSFALLLLVPFLINIVLTWSSGYTHIVFFYDETNGFCRGILGYQPFITSGLYLLVMCTITLIRVKQHKIESTLIIVIALLSAGGALMESIWKFDGTLNMTCAIGIVFYFLFLHVNVYSKDELTNAYNRRIFYIDIKKVKKQAVLIELDLNYLKKLNDEKGHSAGDTALTTLCESTFRCLCHSCTLYRTGGDEFMIICENHDLASAESMMKKVFEDMQKTGYSFAYGCTMYMAGDDVDTAISKADELMYTMKTEMKAQRVD